MPQSIPKGLTTEHVLQAFADIDAGIEHPFGTPTGYEVVHDGKRYPPKAVIGLAHLPLSGQILRPEEFSGGAAPGQANFVIRELGFTVEEKDATLVESIE
jgi:5-methylcytosine-specific restriction protein A